MIKEIIMKTRSYRRFKEAKIGKDQLRDLIDLAKFSASGANLQPLKYYLANEKEKNEIIFSKLKWAGYLTDWNGPEVGERPSAYIIVLKDTKISKNVGCDHGIASQNIVLGAMEMGLGCCMIGSVDRESLQKELMIPDQFEILHVIAIGKPGEEIVIEPVGPDGNIKYWRDNKGVHHVPKRSLEEVIIS